MFTRTLALLLVPTALAAQDATADLTCADAPREAIAAVRAAYMDAFNDGRIDQVVALHAEDVVSMPAGIPAVEGRDALRSLMAGSLDAAPEGFRFEFEARELRLADGWAVERGVTAPASVGDTAVFPAGKYVLLYQRDGAGCWRIAWSITNSDAPRP